MLAAISLLYGGGAMGMKTCGKAGALGSAQVGARQDCPPNLTLLGLLFDDLYRYTCRSTTASSSQIVRQQVLTVEAPAFAACFMPLTVM